MSAPSNGKLNILFFTHYFPPESNAPASRVHETCRHWVRQGHDVTVVTCAPNVPDGKIYPGYRNRLTQQEVIDGIHVNRVWTYIAANRGKRRRSLNYLSYLVSAIIRALYLKRPDVIIATSPQFFCGWTGALARYVFRVPFILEIRDIWPDSIVAVGAMRGSRKIRLMQWLERKSYASATHIVTVGEGYRQRLLSRNVPFSKISIITNGVDRGLFKQVNGNRELKTKLGLRGKFVCSYVGTIGMACGLDVVLRAAKSLKDQREHDVVFLLVGAGAVREELEAKAKHEQLDNVIFAGQQEKSSVPAFLSVADCCLVHLTRNEIFKSVLPSKIFEALAMKRPVILGVEGYAAQVVEEIGGGICIEPENEQQLLSAIKALKSDPQHRAMLGARGHAEVVRNYDRERLASDYLHVIEQVIKFKKPEKRPQVLPQSVMGATPARKPSRHRSWAARNSKTPWSSVTRRSSARRP